MLSEYFRFTLGRLFIVSFAAWKVLSQLKSLNYLALWSAWFQFQFEIVNFQFPKFSQPELSERLERANT